MIDLIQKKLTAYGAANQLEEEQAIKEILQDIVLYGLWRANFFEEFGLRSEVLNKNKMDQQVKKALIKDSSICTQLIIFQRQSETKAKNQIRN